MSYSTAVNTGMSIGGVINKWTANASFQNVYHLFILRSLRSRAIQQGLLLKSNHSERALLNLSVTLIIATLLFRVCLEAAKWAAWVSFSLWIYFFVLKILFKFGFANTLMSLKKDIFEFVMRIMTFDVLSSGFIQIPLFQRLSTHLWLPTFPLIYILLYLKGG